jgi:hypothetical protein
MLKKGITKIISGEGKNPTRFHDEEGNLIDVGGLLYLPHCLGTTLMRLAMDRRPELPWLGYRAINRLDELLQPDWKMLEFGSGLSTIWFAKRCKLVVSIESNKKWYKFTKKNLNKKYENVDCILRESEKRYSKIKKYPDGHFDFALIDGELRDECAGVCIDKVKKGGYIYLDNTDKDSDKQNGEMERAENILKGISSQDESEYFVDFVPTCFWVTQGLLVRKKY